MNNILPVVACQVLPTWFCPVCSFILGTIVGSFLNVCIHRIPRGDSIVAPRSRCYQCGKTIRWFDNIPLLSYILLRGKCRDCGARFSIRYWMVELITALLFVAIWREFDVREAIAYTIFTCGLIVATFIDFEHYIIPNKLTWGGVVVGLILSGIIPTLQNEALHVKAALWSLVGALTGYGVLWGVVELGKHFFGVKKVILPSPTKILLKSDGIQIGTETEVWEEIFARESDLLRFDATHVRLGNKIWDEAKIQVNWQQVKIQDEVFNLSELGEVAATTQTILVPREAMGFGDVKFLAAIGAFLGPKSIFFIILISSLTGSLVGLATILIGEKAWGLKLPYGPYLALASIIWIFWGSQWMSLYIQWLGR